MHRATALALAVLWRSVARALLKVMQPSISIWSARRSHQAMNWSSLAAAVRRSGWRRRSASSCWWNVFAGERRRGLTPTLTLLALAVGAGLTVQYDSHAATVLFEGIVRCRMSLASR